MSKKDVDKYYNQIASDYVEMLESLKDMEELYQQELVSPEQYKQLKEQIEPLKDNYMRISYIMFLLNKPVKKKKVNKYINQVRNKYNMASNETAENKNVLNKLKEFTK